MKKTFDETVKYLRDIGLVYEDQDPKLPVAIPQYDDADPCGFSIFRTGIEDLDLSNLDMRRTFFSKSEISKCSFTNTDLSESNLCWNDFIDVNFIRANISKSDLRASIYENVDFTESDLRQADLRLSSFNNCIFDSAKMAGAKLSKAAGAALKLSNQQINEIDWQKTEGEEPKGG